LNADEFQELKKFGTGIEKTNQEIIKKEPKKKINLKNFLRKIYKLIISFFRWLHIKTKSTLIKIKNWLAFKKDLRKIKKSIRFRYKRKDLGYKIVETKKQRGNKTVITRKRVPFYFDINSYKSELNNISGIFYLSEKDKNAATSEYCYFVKKSIWDFPVHDKKIIKFVLFWRK
jgi:hypothetical protein